VPHPYDERAAAQRIAERDYLNRAAHQLRRRAIADGYAGIRGQDTALAFAAAMESCARGSDPRGDLMSAARRILEGPDGPGDARSGGAALTKGW
jgi:hypothetical protein